MMLEKFWVASIDIGGTNLKGGVVECVSGTLAHQRQIPTEAKQGVGRVTENFLELAGLLLQDAKNDEVIGEIRAIAYDTPGIVDLKSGIVIASCENIPGFNGHDLPGRIKETFSLPVYNLNDAKAFTLGEARYGAGRGLRNFGVWTLGTGVGGGLFLDGKLFLGHRASAGELGHLIIDPGGPLCNQGHYGCVESFAGTNAILNLFEQELSFHTDWHIHPLAAQRTVKDIFKLAEKGRDAVCGETVKKTAKYLAMGIGTFVKMLGLEAAIIGGKIAREDFFLEMIEWRIVLDLFPVQRKNFKVIRAKHCDEGGILGAAAYAAERLGFEY